MWVCARESPRARKMNTSPSPKLVTLEDTIFVPFLCSLGVFVVQQQKERKSERLQMELYRERERERERERVQT